MLDCIASTADASLACVQAALYDAPKRRGSVETVRQANKSHSADARNRKTRHVDSGHR